MIVTFVAQQKGGAVKSIESFPPGVRISNAFVSYIIYIGKMVWPAILPFFILIRVRCPLASPGGGPSPWRGNLNGYPDGKEISRTWPWDGCGIGYTCAGHRDRAGGDQAMADRYTYIPLIGLFIMAAWGIPELLKIGSPPVPPRKEALFVSSALILPCLLIVTWIQVGYWRNNITLYDHTLKVTDHNDVIHDNRVLPLSAAWQSQAGDRGL